MLGGGKWLRRLLGLIPSRAALVISQMKLCYRRSMPPSLRNSIVKTIETFFLLFFVHRVHAIIWTWHYLVNTRRKAPANCYSVRLFSLLISKHPFKSSSFSWTHAFAPFVWKHRPGIETEGIEVKGIGCLSVAPILFFSLSIECCSFEKLMQCAQTRHTDGDGDSQLWIFCHCLEKKRRITDKRLQ